MSPRRPRIAWQDGDERVQRWIERWGDGDPDTYSETLHETDRRLLYRLESRSELALDSEGAPAPRSVVVKVHRTHSGPRRRRESIKNKLGLSPALREWRALCDLHSFGVPVPEPLAWGVLGNGDSVVVTEYFDGRDAVSALQEANPEGRIRIIERIRETVGTLHTTGFRHGDLHLGNVLVSRDTALLIDFQRSRAATHPEEQQRDLAQLELSLSRAEFPVALRRSLRLPASPPDKLDSSARRFNRDFIRGRSRKQFRIGGDWGEARVDTLRGLYDTRYSLSALERALRSARAQPRPDAHGSAATRIDARHVAGTDFIVKRSEVRSNAFAWLDQVRGSAAKRAFRRGQRLALLGPLGARPVAAFDDAQHRPTRTSWLVLERVGSLDLDAYQPDSETTARRCLLALVDWIAEWHAWGIDHLDLKAGNIRMEASATSFQFWLVDLGDLRFRRRLSARSRLRTLVQLNASLADNAFSLDARRIALEAYQARVPFTKGDPAAVAGVIARQSVARKHRWLGTDCPAVEPKS